MTKDSEGNEIPGSEEEVKLTKKEFDELTRIAAEKAQNEANMAEEIKDLRKKNQDLKANNSPIPAEEISKAMEKEFSKRDSEDLKRTQELVLGRFLDAHPEFSKEEDKDGSKFLAFQKALARINLSGVKTEEDYAAVLDDALRLTGQVVPTMPQNFSSTPRGSFAPSSSNSSVRLLPTEAKLVQENFGGDVEKYLAVKAKRPEYIEELLKWVRP